MVKFSDDEQAAFWELFEAGVPYKKIGRTLGARAFVGPQAHHVCRREAARSSGSRSQLRLSLAEREEISQGLAAGRSLRQIAAGLERTAVDSVPGGERQRGPAGLSGVVCGPGGVAASSATQRGEARSGAGGCGASWRPS